MSRLAISILAVVGMTLTFMGLLFGAEIAERAFPTFSEPTSGGFFGVLEGIIAVIQAIWGIVVFTFALITFDVPGAPWWIRVPVGFIMGGGTVWAIASLVRGTST